jgi:hypothetical protein
MRMIDWQCFERQRPSRRETSAANRFGYCMASAVVDELRNSLEDDAQREMTPG